MMASVSIAARDSLRVSTVSLLSSQERSDAVRKLHLPATAQRLTPRAAYSCCRRTSEACTSTPCGSRSPSSFSLRGSEAANSIASSSRSSSGRACASFALSSSSGSVSGVTTCILTRPIVMASPSLIRTVPGGRRIALPDRCRRLPLAHVERRERLMLVELGDALAHQLECGRETRREHGRCMRGLDHVLDQEVVEPRPVARLPDQPLQRLARLGERPHCALGEPHPRECMFLPLLRIGGEQVVQRCRPLRMLDMGDGLGLPAAE